MSNIHRLRVLPALAPRGLARLSQALVFVLLVALGAGLSSGPAHGAAVPSDPAASTVAKTSETRVEDGKDEGHAAGAHQLPKTAKELFEKAYSHVLPHKTGLSLDLGRVSMDIYNVQYFQLIALALILLIFWHVLASARGFLDKETRPNWLARVFSGWVMFIRDEMVVPLLGEEKGKALLPYFLYVFFFVAFMNLLGLIPMGVTATASIFVTAGLALTTFALMIGGGMLEQGPLAFWKNLVPHGVPGWLVPLMFFVEVIGLLVKPFALMIRLFANMTGGHLVVLSFMTLIPFFGYIMDVGSMTYAIAVPAVGLSVFIMIIEGFVALLQAYIFTYLSILFVGMCLHPEH